MENFVEKAAISALPALLPAYEEEEIAVNRAIEVAQLLKSKLQALTDQTVRKEFAAERGDPFFHPVLTKHSFIIQSEDWQYRQDQLILRDLGLCFNTDEECSEAVDKLNSAFVFR